MLNAKNLPKKPSANKAPNVEPGTYPARLVQFVVCGIQPQGDYKGDSKPPCLEIRLTWEMLDEFLTDEDGEPDLKKPRWLREQMRFYSLDQEKATSTHRYYALDPSESFGGDWSKLVGTPAMINVVINKSKTSGLEYNKVKDVSTMRAKEAAKAPPLVNEPLIFDFYEPDMATLQKLPEWMIEHFKEAVDYKGSNLEQLIESIPAGLGRELDDQIPFKEKAKEAPNTKAPVDEDDDEEGWT